MLCVIPSEDRLKVTGRSESARAVSITLGQPDAE